MNLFMIRTLDLLFETDLFQVQHDIGNVLKHALDRGEFVFNAFEADGRDGKTFQGRNQDTAQGIPY